MRRWGAVFWSHGFRIASGGKSTMFPGGEGAEDSAVDTTDIHMRRENTRMLVPAYGSTI